MHYGFVIPAGDLFFCAEIAQAAEAAGWDGIFIPDCISIDTPEVPPGPTYDPWITLAAMALHTQHIRMGTMLTAIPRRRPWKLAQELVTLDHLSRGRMILAAGLGAASDDAGFYRVGEAMDRRVRAALLDEGLQILAGVWRGEPFTFHGQHYHVDGLTLLPTPVQQPRIPIWVVGAWPSERSMARALCYDGLLPALAGSPRAIAPDDLRAMHDAIILRRDPSAPYDLIWEGRTPGDDPARDAAQIQPYIETGITWWLESMWFAPNAPEDIRRRVTQGPPRR